MPNLKIQSIKDIKTAENMLGSQNFCYPALMVYAIRVAQIFANNGA
jgi:hypothetical protein